MVYFAAFVLLMIGVWAYQDAKSAKVSSLWMAIPIGLGFAVDWYSWTVHFLPMFLILSGLYVVVNKKTPFKLGFADVMSVPFAVWVTMITGFWMLVAFPLVLGAQMIVYNKLPRLLVPPKDTGGNIKFVPVVFNAFLIALLLHLVIPIPS